MGFRLLVIDDDALDRTQLGRAVAPLGDIDEAPDVERAVEAVKKTTYDLAVVDYFLTPLSGPQVLQALREHQPGLSAIFLADNGDEGAAADAIKSGAEDYVSKAVLTNPRELRRVVRLAIESGRLRLETERTHNRLQLAVEAAQLGTWSYDPGTRVFRGDGRFESFFGLPPGGEWPESTVLSVFAESDRAAVSQGLANGRIALQLPLGPTKWVDLRGRRERLAPREIFGTTLDVSAQKTAELRSTSLREKLMGIAGHDLKNPLSAVKQASSLLAKSSNLDERERKFVAHIRSSAERMTNLVVQLLDLTRVRLGGGLPVVRQKTDVKQLVAAAVDELRLAYPGRVIDCELEAVERNVDPDRLAQVVSNLVGNSLKHSPANTTVTVTLTHKAPLVVFSVHNWGTPISHEALKLIFEPFVQLGDPSLRDGLGLGLHISHEIVQAHGGTITVTSSAEAGTRFSVHLPA